MLIVSRAATSDDGPSKDEVAEIVESIVALADSLKSEETAVSVTQP